MKKILSLLMTVALVTTNVGAVKPVWAEAVSGIAVNSSNQKVVETIKAETRKTEFTDDWKFNLGAVSGAEDVGFDDSEWRTLDLPHDWSIELDFNPNSPATHEGGFLDGGTAWYRKTFTVDESMKGKKVSIDFDGVYMESTVYVNGTRVGEYQNGYLPFTFDISEHLNFDGEENVIAVKVVNQQPSSRWYSGSGIYRNVYLTTTNNIHVDRYGTFVTTPTLEEDLATDGNAAVNVKTKIDNAESESREVTVRTKILSPTGEFVTQVESNEVLSSGVNEITHDLSVQNPILWAVYEGNLYKTVTEVLVEDNVLDTYETTFGFRYFDFDANTGFSLNGEYMKLNGVCMHHDLGSLGSALNYRAAERQVEKLKDMGVNAIRITHLPASNEYIEICEKAGMLLIDEAFDCWEQSKKTYDYGRFFNRYAERDIKSMVDRGKNSPAIIMWSIGNEIYDTNTQKGVDIAKNLVKWVKEVDPTRPTTIGEDKYRGSKVDGVPNYHTYRDQIMDIVDVAGYNYSENVYDVHHEDNPERKMYGSEISSAVRSRGIYLDPSNPNISDWNNLQTSSYDNSVVGWGRSMEDSTKRDRDRQFSAGQFIWTGFDYIGEPTPFYNSFPAKNSYFGAIDTAGFEKDAFYFYQSQWTEDPMVHILPHWNWEEGENVEVWAYSNVDTVELFLNGESLGERSFEEKTTDYGLDYLETTDGKLHLEWDVPFEPGTLKAVAKEDGVVVAEKEITTAGEPAGIKLTSDRQVINADGDDLSFVTVDIVDENGVIVPDADNLVEFEVTGGILAGVDNGNAASVERYKDTKRKAFSGKALAILQATDETGEITIKAKSKGLESDITTVYKVETTEGIEDQIVGINTVLLNVDKGEVPQLPSEVGAVYGDNSTKNVSVDWDELEDGAFDEIGVVRVKGTVEGTDKKAEAIITVRDIVGVKPHSTFTKVSVAPTLPENAWVLYSDGKEESRTVVWNEIDPSSYAEVGNFTVEGTVEGLENFKAEVRVRVTDETTRENVALNTSEAGGRAVASFTGEGDSVSQVNDGVISYGNSPKNRWTNWPKVQSDWVSIEWDEPQTFDNMNIYFFADSGCTAPSSYEIEYFNGEEWVTVSNFVANPETPTNNAKHEVTFDEITTNKVRVNMQPTNKSLALTEIEIFSDVIVAKDEAKLESITLNGVELEGFSPEVTEYEVYLEYGAELPVIEAVASENGVESILPATSIPGEAKITVVSESGKNEKVYTIGFTSEEPYLDNVVIAIPNTNINEDDLVDLNIESYLVNGELADSSEVNIEYITSDKNIVDFRNGQIAALGEGEAEVYVRATHNGITVASNTLTIQVAKSNESKIILSLDSLNITTARGVKPVLPITVTANYNVGLSRNKIVTWEDINEEDYQNVGTFEVSGTVEGTSIKALAKVVVKGEVGVEQVSAVTLVKEAPVLPSEVTVYYSDNTENKLPVVWDEISEEFYDEAGEFRVYGTVEGSNLRPMATVRVTDESVKGLNISRFQNGYDYPRTAASYSNEPPNDPASNDRLAHINNDIISFENSPHDRWTNWKRTPDTTGWVSVEFGRSGPEDHYFDEVAVHYFTDHGVYLPKSAKVQYKNDGNWVDVTNQTVENGEHANTKVYKFDKVKSSEVRLFMEAQSGKSLGITELQIFKNDVIKNTNNKASEIKLNGELLEGFNEDTFKYEIELESDEFPVITAKAIDNAAVTIVQATKSSRTAKVIVKGEDGSQNIYEINFVKDTSVSKVDLEAKIAEANEKANGNYTEATLKVLNDAIDYAVSVNEDEASTQYKVNSTIALLNDAIAQLIEETPEEVSADLNNDGKVDIGDLAIASKYYGQNKPEYDLNDDDIIDDYEIEFITSKILN